jgi:hypothetical protein
VGDRLTRPSFQGGDEDAELGRTECTDTLSGDDTVELVEQAGARQGVLDHEVGRGAGEPMLDACETGAEAIGGAVAGAGGVGHCELVVRALGGLLWYSLGLWDVVEGRVVQDDARVCGLAQR